MPQLAVLERDLEIVELLREALQPEGWEIALYGDAEDLIEAAQDEIPDVVLIDVAPRESQTGWNTLPLLKDECVMDGTPIIVNSRNLHDLHNHCACLDVCASAVLVRPCTADDIRHCVRSARDRSLAAV